MILESERRWDDWQGGQPIELPDGEIWYFYQPAAQVQDGVPGWTFNAPDPTLDTALSHRFGWIIAKWGRAIDDADRAAAILEAAWFLLARNYRLTQAEFGTIMLRAASWDRDRHERFAEQILTLVGLACLESTELAEVA